MKDIDFVLFYEGTARELDNLVLLKKELEHRGYSVAISHFLLEKYAYTLKHYEPKVVVTPWLRNDFNLYRLGYRFRKWGHKIVDLQWEQVLSIQRMKDRECDIRDEAKKAYHLCWGNYRRNVLIENGIDGKLCPIVGVLQQDFCRDEFSDFYLKRDELAKEFGLDVKKKWILYISSFAITTMSEKEIKNHTTEFSTINQEIFEKGLQSKYSTLQWMEHLLEKINDIELIYRPHPGERNDEKILEMSKNYKNFHTIHHYSIKQWIKVCDIVDMWQSTSVSEVWAMKKSCRVIRPVELNSITDNYFFQNARSINTQDLYIETAKIPPKEFPIDESVFRDVYDINTQPAYKRIADQLEEIYKSDWVIDAHIPDEELKKIKKLYGKDFIKSWLVDYIDKTGIDLEKISPMKKEKCRRFMERHIGIGKQLEEIDNKLSRLNLWD